MKPKLYSAGTCVRENPGHYCRSSEEVEKYCREKGMCIEKQEVFWVLSLSTRLRVISRFEVGRGTISTCPVSPKEVFRPLIVAGAASCMLIHCHPSGDPEPSPDDIALTRRLHRAGTLLDIRVIDHLIIAEDGYVSLAARGILT